MYFTRKYDHGKFIFNRLRDGGAEPVLAFNGPNLVMGRATISFDLPPAAKVGETVDYEMTVEDEVTQQKFVNYLHLQIAPAQKKKGNAPSVPHLPPGSPPHPGKDGHSGIAFPEVLHYTRTEAKWAEHFSDVRDCLNVIEEPVGDNSEEMKYTFYMNDDNIALQTELKGTKLNPPLVKKQFEIGAVLVGLALIYDERQKVDKPGDDDEADVSLGEQVKKMTRALSPVLLPMIQALGQLTMEDVDAEQEDLLSMPQDAEGELAEVT